MMTVNTSKANEGDEGKSPATAINGTNGNNKGGEQPQGFIRVTDQPNRTLSSEDKVILNRKANAAFNDGNIEAARRIYTATGYSDGLTRVGDKYMEKKRPLTALKQYILAHNNRKTEGVYANIAQLISALLADDAAGGTEETQGESVSHRAI